MNIGDTVFIDKKYRYKGGNVEDNIFVNTSDRFYDYIREHHQKF